MLPCSSKSGREQKGLINRQAHDTELAISTAVDAIRILIKEDDNR